jgi:succinyl-CoA synthetase beta subunit
MKIHEYQAKQILKKYGVPVPRGIPAFSVEDALKAAKTLGSDVWVVKAQIHAGGRGKGGGVKLARSLDEVREHAAAMLGQPLITHQTGPEGQIVRRLYIEEGVDIKKEYYVAVIVDREAQRVALMASAEGGMDIEEVAATTPEKILFERVHPVTGLMPYQTRRLAFGLGLTGPAVRAAGKFLTGLYHVFTDLDCSLAEINPLVVTGSDEVIALDAKLTFDGNALDRHPELAELRDLDEEHPQEVEASKHDLSYINLDGNVGCMVNGAGLAMSTMDIIQHYGGMPANFLDVGGAASRERVAAAFKIITADPRVKGIFVNIFGGIVRCDMLAQGIVDAVGEVGLDVPLVVRLEGTKVEEGRRILEQSGLNVITAATMADGAKKILEAIGA